MQGAGLRLGEAGSLSAAWAEGHCASERVRSLMGLHVPTLPWGPVSQRPSHRGSLDTEHGG